MLALNTRAALGREMTWDEGDANWTAIQAYINRLVLQKSVDVTELGVVMDDPSKAADNTALIQSALDDSTGIYIPSGVCYVNFLTLPVSATIMGDGESRSILSWPQADMATRGNMLTASGDIDGLYISRVAFRGNRAFQTTPTVSGHDTIGLFSRAGSNKNIHINHAKFYNFGDGTTTGGCAIIGALSGTGRTIENIRITESIFENTSNVPGVYINGAAAYHSLMRDVYVDNNIFNVGVTAAQNCIYVLGGSIAAPAHTVSASRNSFNVSAVMDTCIEFNFIVGGKANNNNITVTGIGDCGGILLREGIYDTDVHENIMVNEGTGCANTHGIAVVQLTGSGVQDNISIVECTVKSWGVGGSGGPLAVTAGSTNITVAICKFSGRGSGGSDRTGTAMTIAAATQVDVIGCMIRYCNYVAVLGPVTRLDISGCSIFGCGDGAVGMIVDSVADQAITNLTIKNNRVRGTIAGTPNFVSVSPAATTGNRVENNDINAINPVNPSLRSKFAAIVTPSNTGALLAGRTFTFNQGLLSIANGSGFTIGANLDGTLSGEPSGTVAFGDMILVSAPGSLLGCVACGYVDAANRIRIRVQNHTGSSVDVVAGDWKVTVIKV